MDRHLLTLAIYGMIVEGFCINFLIGFLVKMFFCIFGVKIRIYKNGKPFKFYVKYDKKVFSIIDMILWPRMIDAMIEHVKRVKKEIKNTENETESEEKNKECQHIE